MVTLLDHLPSLRRAATQRIAAGEWPDTTVVDELGRLCVGGVALPEVAAEFGSPATVVDEVAVRRRLHRCRTAMADVVPLVAARGLPTAVLGWIDDEGLGLAVRHARDLAAARAAGARTSRMVLHARSLSHDELVAGAAAEPGRVVVESTTDVAYLGSAVRGRQRVLIGTLGGQPDPAVIERVLPDPSLELVGFHCSSTDVDASVRTMLSAIRLTRRLHGVLLTEVHLTIEAELDPAELAATVDDAVEAACAATRVPRPRLVVESRWPITRPASVTVCQVTAVLSPPTGPQAVIVEAGTTRAANGIVALANRHPLSPTERMAVFAGDVDVARDVELPCDVHAGDVLAVAGAEAADATPVIGVRGGLPRILVRRMTAADMLSRDVGYSARGNHQHVAGLNPDGHRLPGTELPGL